MRKATKQQKTRTRKPHVEKCYACGAEFRPKGKSNLYCPDCREREMRKSTEAIKQNCTDYLIKEFVTAIIKRAASDYATAIRKWHKAYTPQQRKSAYNEIQRWSKYWRGQDLDFYALQLDGLEGEHLQRAIGRGVFEKIRDARINKGKQKKKKKERL